MITYFSTFQLLAIVTAASLGILTIVFLHTIKKYRTAIFLLFIAAFAIRITIIQFDPYLNYWDEQYHALVAKNMMQQPFKPMLYEDPALPYQPEMWIANHVWLHKPPLFLWQMALSMKIFGVNEFGLRLPNVIMSMLCMLMVYAMARRWLNKYIAFYAALIMAFSSYSLDLVSGYHHSEHNDVAFIFYVTLSLYAWTRYVDTRKINWVVAVGLASGAAVLVKWLPGLLIYAAWGASIITSQAERTKISAWGHLFLALLVTIIVFMPWQIYTALAFPEEYRITSIAKARHFWEVIEGHSGNIFYHFNKLDTLYATGVKFVLIPAMFLMARKIQNKSVRVGLLLFFIVAFLFYSIAATKMTAFTLIASAVVYLALGTFIYEVLLFFKPRYYRFVRIGRLTAVILLSGSLFWFFNIENLQKYHTNWHKDIGYHRSNRIIAAQVFREMGKLPLDEKTIVLNCKDYDPVMLMFYTSFTAYSGLPDEGQMALLLNSGRPLIAFDSGDMEAFFERYPGVGRYDGRYHKPHAD